jgi:hypothetical protein
MTSTTEKIRSRGHWDVTIHPSDFIEKRIPRVSELRDIVEKHAVNFRGWNFPHVSPEGAEIGVDWTQSEVDWSNYIEVWRFYQSGQFLFLGNIRQDWYDQSLFHKPSAAWAPGKLLSVGDTVFKLTEIFEFANRLAVGPLAASGMVIDIRLVGLKGRQLAIEDPNRTGFAYPRESHLSEFPMRYSLTTHELVARTRELAVDAAAEVFEHFDWSPGTEMLKGMQEELFQR